ncbi:hypothetical protein DXG01_011861 [Tephrocybe rancida]|nr:hypothetical protein DXG01_011861 [Tephrocybe rancida]
MLFSNKKTLTLTLIVYTVLANAHIHQRDHVNLKRLIKKRAPQDQPPPLIPVAGAGAAVPVFSSSTSSVTSTATSASQTSTALPLSNSLSDSLSASTSTSASLSDSSTSLSVSSTLSSSSSTSTSTSTPPSTTPPAPTTEPAADTATSNPTPTLPKPVVTVTSSVDASQSFTSIPQAAAAAAKPKSMTITILIAVGASIAGIAILWTVFRKWKLGRSSKFDERLQPIDWRPTNDDDEALPGHHRRHSGASSFRSAGHSAHGHGSDVGHNSPSSYALPDHDFTAGPTTLAPVGGYADLSRGPSPQPQMNQTGGSAMMSRPAYDVGVPLHHQGYSSQDSYDYGGARR